MGIRRFYRLSGGLIALAWLTIVRGQTVERVYAFTRALAERPASGLAKAKDGSLYGLLRDEQKGSTFVYKIAQDGMFTRIGVLDPRIYGAATGELTVAGHGEIFGITSGGAIFRIDGGGTVIMLAELNGAEHGTDPRAPLLVAADGSLYGTTSRGGKANGGTLFKFSSQGVLSVVASFTETTGSYPVGSLAQSNDGTIYGVCHQKGVYRKGTVFKLATTGTLSALYSFDGKDGSFPLGGLIVGRDGNLYGTTSETDIIDESYFGRGTVFSLSPTGQIKTLLRMDATRHAFPRASLIQTSDGILYGTASDLDEDQEDIGRGGIFAVSTNGQLRASIDLNPEVGWIPESALVEIQDSSLATVTRLGGRFGWGAIIKVSPNKSISALKSFEQLTDPPRFPLSGLTVGPNGDLYGSTVYGGLGYGTIYRLSPNGAFTNLYSFRGTNGARADLPLTLGPDGYLYGATVQGGVSNLGTIFKISAGGDFRSLFSFTGENGAMPVCALVNGGDQKLYGMTAYTSEYSGPGVIFEITTNGQYAVLYSFANDGSPTQLATLIAGGDGSLYGTTHLGGDFGRGSVFRLTTNGVFNTLHSFNGDDGTGPGPLIAAADGTLYGITYGFGLRIRPTLFKITPSREFVTLAFIDPKISAYGVSFVFAKDGALFATINDNGGFGEGTLLRITPTGDLLTIHSFYPHGRRPAGALAVADDGFIYGTASAGGEFQSGSIFRFDSPLWVRVLRIGNSTSVRWAAGFDQVHLEITENIGPEAQWRELTEVPVHIDGELSVTVPAAGVRRFFRLKK